ncbi:hypothetical protein SESBI_28814 [Sesbania bispinosa]|nr:hypothetical protein SESBI_28814 [Sesbania bispinosa]
MTSNLHRVLCNYTCGVAFKSDVMATAHGQIVAPATKPLFIAKIIAHATEPLITAKMVAHATPLSPANPHHQRRLHHLHCPR